ncbi:MAG: lipocalin family protein [Bacteroidaceae bacterium]|nr:lipocalin family protein [Bacteroidaceae bacterium]
MAMKMMLSILASLFSFSFMGDDVDNSTVESLDVHRFMGKWYEIARFDHSFERGLTHTTAYYSLKNDGSIAVKNSGLKDGRQKTTVGKAKMTDTAGLLRVSFFGPFYSDYRVMMVSADYKYAIIGSKNSKYLWILSRTPGIPSADLEKIQSFITSRGYNLKDLIWVDHT